MPVNVNILAAIFFLCCSVVLLAPSVVHGDCSVLYGGENPTTISLPGLRLFLDLDDEELSNVPNSLRFYAAEDGSLDLIKNGQVDGFFQSVELISLVPPIPSSTRVIPIHIEAMDQIYYSLSILSSNEAVLGPFIEVTSNEKSVAPSSVGNSTVNFCCKANGTVILEGCLTVANGPFQEYSSNTSFVTIQPFFARYQCSVPKVEGSSSTQCPSSFTQTSVKVEWCFSLQQTRALILSDQEGWGVIGGFAETAICGVARGAEPEGVYSVLATEDNTRSVPIGPEFPSLEYFFNRLEEQYDWTSPTYYSLSLTAVNETVLGVINASIPLEGTFNSSIYNFTVYLPCLENGATIIDTQLKTSGLIDGYVVNNSYSFFFYKICMPYNNTADDTDIIDKDYKSKSENLLTILTSTLIPVIFVITVVSIVLVVLIVYGVRQRRQVQQLEQLTINNTASSDNTYSFANVFNPFDFLDHEDQALEYNYAAIEVVDRLGEGFFGTVYKAKAPGLSRGEHLAGEFVAVKTLKKAGNPQTLTDFAKELKVCIQFDHPNVIRLLGVCTTSFEKCMIFEYMDLGSLDHRLRASNPGDSEYDPSGFILSIKDFLPIVVQLAKGLDYLSSLDFIHRDVAARNCLLNSQLTAKIADFGLSRNLNAQNYYRVGGGKKSYLPIRWMPPEAILYGKFTPKSDVWSFGILSWEIYSFGQLPYTGLSNHEVIDRIKEYRGLDRPDTCPPGVYDIMRSCWTRLPSQRPTMDRVVYHLELFSQGRVDNTAGGNYVNLLPTNSDDKL